jgi:transcriptional regulator with GAF, ATPase, and Fis domain
MPLFDRDKAASTFRALAEATSASSAILVRLAVLFPGRLAIRWSGAVRLSFERLDQLWQIAASEPSSEALARVGAGIAETIPVVEVALYDLDLDNGVARRFSIVAGERGDSRPIEVPLDDEGALAAQQWVQALTGPSPVGAAAEWPEPVRDLHRGGPPMLGIMRRLPGEAIPIGWLAVAFEAEAVSESSARTVIERLLGPLALAAQRGRLDRELTALREHAELAAGRRPPMLHEDHDGLSDRVIGAEGGLRAVMERLRLAGPTDITVLILGETGSGKEVVARTLHAQSSRARGPFVRVNCGAIPSELIDSELFGHERGSFTGAVATRRGWFERAHGGTLFLDEVGELSLAAQVRLLRVLQEGKLRRVGGEKMIAVDVRVVAATHRDLGEMVARGSFREDLWYRLAVFAVDLPPLRDHVEDIPAMAEFFSRRAAARFNLPLRLPTAEDLALLTGYPWPGNVRELAAVIDRAVLLGQGRSLEVGAALGQSSLRRTTAVAIKAPSSAGSEDVAPLRVVVERHVRAALHAAGGRIEGPRGAARLLQLNPHTLRSRMRKLGIDWSRYRGG